MSKKNTQGDDMRFSGSNRCPECDCIMAHRSGCLECPICGYAHCTS